MTLHKPNYQPEQALELRLSGDPDARTSWVLALTDGPLTYRGSEREITKEYLQKVASETRRSLYAFEGYAISANSKNPYRWPVIREHTPQGERDGSILDAKVSETPDGKSGLYLKVQWQEATWNQIELGEVSHVSVRIDARADDQTGESYGPLVTELSLTSRPVLKGNIGAIQDTLQLQLSDKLQLTEEEKSQMDELLTKLMEHLAGIDAKLDEIKGMMPEPKEEEPEKEESPDEEAPEEELSEEGADEDEEDMQASEEVRLSEIDKFREQETRRQNQAQNQEPTLKDLFQKIEDLSKKIEDGSITRQDQINLNLAETGNPGRAPQPKPRTESDWFRMGREKGLSGLALARFVLDNK